MDIGKKVEASEWDDGWCGIYKNGIYGVYTLFVYSGVSEYIVVYHKDGVLVFNCKNLRNTEKVYYDLKEKCGI